MSEPTPHVVALVPARAGSKRVAGKNVRLLGGHPLMAYTIAAARQSEVFADVIVSTDSSEYADIARHYGASVPFLRPAASAGDLSPDIEWVEHALEALAAAGRRFEAFSILRPTSPFRLPQTIVRAWQEFTADPQADSLRAVERCRQHPGKMWVVQGRRMTPLLPFTNGPHPWHSSQYQALPEIHVQNASLEIAWTRVVRETRTIAGRVVMPFFTQGSEGLDVNTAEDWTYAERLVSEGLAPLPDVRIAALP